MKISAPQSYGGVQCETLLNNFNLRCVDAGDGPDEWKAVLEKRFRLLAADVVDDGLGADAHGTWAMAETTIFRLPASSPTE